MKACNVSSGSLIKNDFFHLLRAAIKAINPGFLITKNVQITTEDSKDYLTIPNNLLFRNSENELDDVNERQSFLLNKNVHVVAFGKAALGTLSMA